MINEYLINNPSMKVMDLIDPSIVLVYKDGCEAIIQLTKPVDVLWVQGKAIVSLLAWFRDKYGASVVVTPLSQAHRRLYSRMGFKDYGERMIIGG